MAEKPAAPAPGSNAPTTPIVAPETTPKPGPKPALPQRNPAFQALGLPNWRPKLPSRNWLIFWTVLGSFTTTILYDRHMKKKHQEKWCNLVSHIAHESIPTNTTVRKLTVYLAAPPGQSLRDAREHFVEYVKPVLVSGALDWEVVEGRREGEVRLGLADRIRRYRRKRGEGSEVTVEEEPAVAIERLRDRMGVQAWHGQQGDIVVGRHTWREYVRGLHEGWLGPLTARVPPPPPPSIESTTTAPTESSQQDDTSSSETTPPPPEKEKPKPEEKPETPPVTPPYNATSSYPSSSLPPSIPSEFAASAPIKFPTILGFRNTPIRTYRWLTQRYLADDIGRETAAIVLATYRPYTQSLSDSGGGTAMSDTPSVDESSNSDAVVRATWEQQRALAHEERDWWKKSIKRTEGEGERVWLDDMVVDARIGERMRRFELDAEDEDRAKRIGKGIAYIPGRGVDVDAEGEARN